MIVVDEVNCLCKNFQPLVIGNILKTQGYRAEDAYLFNKDQKRILFAVNISIFRPKDMPIVAPNETDQLYHGYYKGRGAVGYIQLTVAPKDQISVGAFQRRLSIASGLRKMAAPMT